MPTLFHGAFPELQSKFIEFVREQRTPDPIAPLTVIVTGQLVRLHLRRELARCGVPWLNVRFLTLHEFAHNLAAPEIAERELRLLPDVAIEPLLHDAIRRALPRLNVLRTVAERPGFRRALWKAICELRMAGINAARLQTIPPAFEGRRMSATLLEIAHILVPFEEMLSGKGVVDQAELLEIATRKAIGLTTPIIFYGQDALAPRELVLVRALPLDQFIAAFIPHTEHSDYLWTRPLVEWFRTMAPSESLPRHDPEADVHFISAPTREREAEEIVRQLFTSPLANSAKRSCAILLRAADPYVPLLRAELSQADVTGYVHRCATLADTPLGRGISCLLSLLDEQARVDMLSDFLAIAPIKSDIQLQSKIVKTAPALWIHFMRQTGMPNSTSELRQQLLFLRDRARAREANDHEPIQTPQAEAIDDFLLLLDLLYTSLALIRAAKTWNDAAGSLNSMTETFFRDDDTSAPFIAELRDLSLLDTLQIAVNPALVRTAVLTALRRPLTRDGRFENDQPTLSTIAESLGVLYDEVHIPGLVEKEFPRPITSDPLISDDDRIYLNEALRQQAFVTRRERAAYDSFLFATAVHSARKRLIMSLPRTDTESGRERLASSLLLQFVRSIDDSVRDFVSLHAFFHHHQSARFLPFNALTAGIASTPTTELQYDLQLIQQVLTEQNARPLAAELLEGAPLRRALTIQHARFLLPDFSEFDGNLDLQVSSTTAKPDAIPMSVSRLELFAACPFQYFAHSVLKLKAYDESKPFAAMTPQIRGIVVHRILERYLSSELRQPERASLEDATNTLERVAQQTFREFNYAFVGPSEFVLRFEQQQIIRRLREWLAFERKRDDGFVAHSLETVFELPVEQFMLRGRIDRVDRAANGMLRIIDYKTGRVATYKQILSLNAGRALQLPIYALALLQQSTARIESAQFLDLSSDPIKVIALNEQELAAALPDARRLMSIVHEEILQGHFFPNPSTERCRICSVRATCGSGRFTAKWGNDRELNRGFRSLAAEVTHEP